MFVPSIRTGPFAAAGFDPRVHDGLPSRAAPAAPNAKAQP